MDNTDQDDPLLGIPDFLRRQPGENQTQPEKDVKMVKRDEIAEAEVDEAEAEAEAPKVGKRKAKPTTNGAAKAKAKPAKAAKPAVKPRKAPADKDQFGYREGSLKSKAAALYSSKKGATLNEVKEKLGSIQLNVLTELKGRGFKVRETKEAGAGTRQITRYFLSA